MLGLFPSHDQCEQFEQARKMSNKLAERGYQNTLKTGVHAMTLKSFIKEQLPNNPNMPLELFGARPIWTTKVK
jgi:hypothetical protein